MCTLYKEGYRTLQTWKTLFYKGNDTSQMMLFHQEYSTPKPVEVKQIRLLFFSHSSYYSQNQYFGTTSSEYHVLKSLERQRYAELLITWGNCQGIIAHALNLCMSHVWGQSSLSGISLTGILQCKSLCLRHLKLSFLIFQIIKATYIQRRTR